MPTEAGCAFLLGHLAQSVVFVCSASVVGDDAVVWEWLTWWAYLLVCWSGMVGSGDLCGGAPLAVFGSMRPVDWLPWSSRAFLYLLSSLPPAFLP